MVPLTMPKHGSVIRDDLCFNLIVNSDDSFAASLRKMNEMGFSNQPLDPHGKSFAPVWIQVSPNNTCSRDSLLINVDLDEQIRFNFCANFGVNTGSP